MILFLASPSLTGGYQLEDKEAHHCVRVLRKRVGDEVHCIDGNGRYIHAVIAGIQDDRVALTVLRTEDGWGEPPIRLTLAVSPLKDKDRFEWLMEKAVELGVSSIVPILCERTEKYSEKLNLTRIKSILLSATKQCKRARIPDLAAPMPLARLLAQPESHPRWMAWCETHDAPQWPAEAAPPQALTWLIGPEGDFSQKEADLAKDAGAALVSLGRARLRTETAAMYALAWVKAHAGF